MIPTGGVHEKLDRTGVAIVRLELTYEEPEKVAQTKRRTVTLHELLPG
jgi:hypothetical protein